MQITVNNRTIEANAGETILDACTRAGIKIPTLCHMKGLLPSGACRICVVDVEGRGLIPSCSHPVENGMVIHTNSQRAVTARKTIIELLQANHPDDCLYCVRNGDCHLQDLSELYGVRERRYTGSRVTHPVDVSSPAIHRDQDKCILCGKCVRVCEEIMGVSAIDFVGRGSNSIIAPAFVQGLNVSSCIACGQCVMVCPTGALREHSDIRTVLEALNNPNLHVVVQHAPSVSVTVAEEFGFPAGRDVNGLMVAALRQLGFEQVFDTGFTADLTIMEEASELVDRIKNKGPLPMFTSCSPGWVKYIEQAHPDYLDHVSTCKSPQQMMGALIKTYYAEKNELDPKKIFSVAIMPCTAKKFEANRKEMGREGVADIDAVLTTRELARIIKMYGIEFDKLEPENADLPLGVRSTAGKLFGSSGGVMEAALRTAYYMLTGEELPNYVIREVRGLEGIKELHVKVGELDLGVAVANGLINAQKLLHQIRKEGRTDLQFIEVMTCPGGCIAGGGQPQATDVDDIRARMQALYNIDQQEPMRASHRNWAIRELYEKWLGEPLGHKSHELLHTHYTKRDVIH